MEHQVANTDECSKNAAQLLKFYTAKITIFFTFVPLKYKNHWL